MTTTDTSPALPVPDEARNFLRSLMEGTHWGAQDAIEVPLSAVQDTVVRAIAASVVAAAFRAFADELSRETQAAFSDHAPSESEAAYLSGIDSVAHLAARRADQLETARTGTPT